MFDYTGKIALVTGSSGEIGKAIAIELANRGAKVAISGTRKEALELIKQSKPESFLPVVCDLEKNQELDNLLPEVENNLGPVDIVVNNAGINEDQLAVRMTDEMWEKVMRINLFSAFKISKLAVKSMMKRRYGRIIQISSVVGYTGNPGQTNYAASKAGLSGFSKALALEVASRNITVNCIAPGFIQTSMTNKLTESQKDTLLKKIPSGKLGFPNDVASACVFLASEEASYINGTTIHVNGGLAMI